MRFDELKLFTAIYHVREHMKLNDEQPGAEHWTQGSGALELTKRIAEELVTEINPLYVEAFKRYRKSGAASEDIKDTKKFDIIVRLCENQKSPECFYRNRGLGECSEDVDLDRILPGSKGGKYTYENCVLACSRHNRERQDKVFDQYVNSHEAT